MNLGPRKPAPAGRADSDLLQILVFRDVLTRDQAERVRRYSRANRTEIVPTIVSLGFATEVKIAEAVAAFAELPFIKINPLELDLDIVTGALSNAFARRHGLVPISKTATTVTVAVHDPFAPFPAEDIKRVTGLEVQRMVAMKSEIEAITKNFYGLRPAFRPPRNSSLPGALSISATRSFSPRRSANSIRPPRRS